MKKILAFVLIAVLMAALSIPAAAVVNLTANNGSPKIDGVLDDSYGGPIPIAGVFQNADGTNNMNPAKGEVWVAWDSGALYFYAVINDTTPNHDSESGDGHAVDNVEFYIDWNNVKATGGGGPLLDNGDGTWGYEDVGTEDGYPYWQVRVPSGPTSDGEQNLSGAMWTDIGWGGVDWASEDHEFVVVPKDGDMKKGYIIEIKIDSPVPLTEGKVLGFDVSIGDNIEGSGRNGQVYLETAGWNDLQWATPNACNGVLKLGGAASASIPDPDPDPEPAPTPDPGPDPEPAPAPAPPAPGPSAPQVGDSALIFIALAVALAGAVVISKRAKNKA